VLDAGIRHNTGIFTVGSLSHDGYNLNYSSFDDAETVETVSGDNTTTADHHETTQMLLPPAASNLTRYYSKNNIISVGTENLSLLWK
jgi:hypothetical protein